jgi:prepilin-type N-terminal cleavage/methylation domain-containing protein
MTSRPSPPIFSSGRPRPRQSGFTLVEIVLALVIIGVISAFMISISSSIRNFGRIATTKVRMETIAEKARNYYLSHKQQAVPGGASGNDAVPISTSALNLEQKYRLDGWGKYLRYLIADRNHPKTITGFRNRGSSIQLGAVVISSGGNQQFDYTTRNESGDTVFTLAGDDIIVGIDFNQEAIAIAQQELDVLQAKVESFDALYEGVDNDGDGKIDNLKCVADDGSSQPPTGNNDPNCGRATLDATEKNFYDTTESVGKYDVHPPSGLGSEDKVTAARFLIEFYNLSPEYVNDPWSHDYRWSSNLNEITPPNSNVEDYFDARHHRFWSMGPDGASSYTTIGTANDNTRDDIIAQ